MGPRVVSRSGWLLALLVLLSVGLLGVADFHGVDARHGPASSSLKRLHTSAAKVKVGAAAALQPHENEHAKAKSLVQVSQQHTAFTVDGLNAVLLQDNPTYERVKRSTLHDLVETLRGPANWNAAQIATMMKRIPMAKWQKYQRTRTYLEREIAGLSHALLPAIVDFHTTEMKDLPGGLQHHFVWSSDTVDGTAGLPNVIVHERVSWPQWPQEAIQWFGQDMVEYRTPNHHVGLGTNPGTKGFGTDNHELLNPFHPSVLDKYQGPPLSITMDQVYEYSHDNGATWIAIPNATYTITRTVTPLGGGRSRAQITKINTTPNFAHDRHTVTKEFDPPPVKK